MGIIYPYGRLGSYAHMKPRDIAIWERFIDEYPDAFEKCEYDVFVGDPPAFNTLWDNDEDKNQDALYRLKIDVLGHSPGRMDIVEVKPEAGPGAIGQLEGYYKLFMRDMAAGATVGKVLVTDMERPNMRYLCEQAGVALFVV
jgi:hypothetical protein